MKYLLLAILCSIPITASGQSIMDDPVYIELRKYDGKNAPNLAEQWDERGGWKKPKTNIMLTLKELKAEIQESAKRQGVDPVMVGAVIMTENSVNCTIEDDVQDLLGQLKLFKKGEVLGKQMSVGLGQLYFTAAREAEDYAAQREGRSSRSDSDINAALFIPEKNIELIAMVIRQVQDDYLKEGFVIDDKIEITSTLYNLGKAKKRAASSKAKLEANPEYKLRPNFFGVFAKKYEAYLAFLRVQVACLAPVFKIALNDLKTWDSDTLLKSLSACSESLQKLTLVAKNEVKGEDAKLMIASVLNMQTIHLKAAIMATSESKNDEAIKFAKVCEKLAQTYDVKATGKECSYLSLQNGNKIDKDAAEITKKMFMNPQGIKLFEEQAESSLEENQNDCDPTNTNKFEF